MAKKAKKKWSRKPKVLSPEQKRNSDIFRLRGFYANANTLPFSKDDLKQILGCVDSALEGLGAELHSTYMKRKAH